MAVATKLRTVQQLSQPVPRPALRALPDLDLYVRVRGRTLMRDHGQRTDVYTRGVRKPYSFLSHSSLI